MPDKIFLDTNLWVYFYAKNPLEKSGQVRRIVASRFEDIVISTQTLGELYNVFIRKKLTTSDQAQAIVIEMATHLPVLEIDTPKVLQVLAVNARYHYSYWDSLVIATALLAECEMLYSKDMHHQQLIDDKLRILNPFNLTSDFTS